MKAKPAGVAAPGHTLLVLHPAPAEFAQAIWGLETWTDQGFLEFRFPPSDQGLYPEPLDSASFARFVARLLEKRL